MRLIKDRKTYYSISDFPLLLASLNYTPYQVTSYRECLIKELSEIVTLSVTKMIKIEQDVCGTKEFDSIPKIENPKSYAKFETRLRSFKDWPRGIPISAEKIAEAGLVYTGRGDRVICFECGGGLKDWESGDDPWMEHAIWFPGCNFLLEKKGQNFIDLARKTKYDQMMNQQQNIQIEISDPEAKREQEDLETCIICQDQARTLVFLPCGHLISCAGCYLQISSCPICRSEIEAVVPVRR